MNQWETWGRRIGAALIVGLIGGVGVWVFTGVILLLADKVPVWQMFAAVLIIFTGTLILDWIIDAGRERRVRDRYEIARRAALGRDDDEL